MRLGPWLGVDYIERKGSLGLGRRSHSLEVVFARVREVVESVVVQPEQRVLLGKPLVDVGVLIGSVDSQIHKKLLKLGNTTRLGLGDLFEIAFDAVSTERFPERREETYRM